MWCDLCWDFPCFSATWRAYWLRGWQSIASFVGNVWGSNDVRLFQIDQSTSFCQRRIGEVKPKTPNHRCKNAVAHVLSIWNMNISNSKLKAVSCSYRVPFKHRQSGGPRFRHTKAMHCDGQSEDGLSRLRQKPTGAAGPWLRTPESQEALMTSPLPALLEFGRQTSLAIVEPASFKPLFHWLCQ